MKKKVKTNSNTKPALIRSPGSMMGSNKGASRSKCVHFPV